jgi:hypothetical protein
MNRDDIAALVESGEHVHYGMGLNVGPILRAGGPTGSFGVWNHYASGAARKPGALDLETTSATEAAERFLAPRRDRECEGGALVRFKRDGGSLLVRMNKSEVLGLGRILAHAAHELRSTTPDRVEEASAWVELAGAVESFTDEPVMGTAEALQVLDGDRDAVESEGDYAKAWRAAWDAAAVDAS